MANFNFTETLISTQSLSFSAPGGSAGGVIYTVPAGRYAKVSVGSFHNASSPYDSVSKIGESLIGSILSGLSVIDYTASVINTTAASGQVIIDEGQTINLQAGTNYFFHIREFSKP